MTRSGAARLAILLASIHLAAAGASAQTFVAVAAGASTQGEGDSDRPYLGPPFGGTSAAIVASLDRAATRNLAFGGEVSLAGAISGAQSQRASGGTNTFVSEHRDTVFSGIARIGTPLDAPVHLAVVVGGGLAQRHTVRNGAFNPDFGLRPSRLIAETLTDWVPAVTVGANLRVALARHVGVVGVARVHKLRDEDRTQDGVVKRGVSSAIVRIGGGVQLQF